MTYSHPVNPPVSTRRVYHTRPGALAMPQRRGSGAGTMLVLLGIWGGIIPFLGPVFDYRMDNAGSWAFTMDRLWLSILPGIAAIVGGLILIGAADRLTASLGAAIALAGGVWFLIGPSVSLLWNSFVADNGIGSGSTAHRFVEQIGFFYGLGAVIATLAAAAWGRLVVRSEHDIALLEARSAAVSEGDAVVVDDDAAVRRPVPEQRVAQQPVTEIPVVEHPETQRPIDDGVPAGPRVVREWESDPLAGGAGGDPLRDPPHSGTEPPPPPAAPSATRPESDLRDERYRERPPDDRW